MVVEDKTDERAELQRAFTEKDLHKCIRCGLCLPVCPTYRITLGETDSPRGRVALMEALAEGELGASEKLTDFIYYCLDCRACQSYCPAGVKPGEAVLQARSYIEERRPQPAYKQMILRWLLFHPQLLDKLVLPTLLYKGSGISNLVRESKLLPLLSQRLEMMEGLLPEYQGLPLRARIPEVLEPYGERKARVLFFLGCAMSSLLGRISEASIELLRKLGAEVIVPPEIKCCGAPHMNEGDGEAAYRLARDNIETLLKYEFDFITSDCAACGAELRHYAEFFSQEPEWQAKAQGLCSRVRDISEVLLGLEPEAERFQPCAQRVSYDFPCHLIHGQNVDGAPLKLIEMVPKLNFVALPEADLCCGSAGSYAMTHPEDSLKVLECKMEHLRSTEADILLTSNPGCYLQLGYGVRKFELPTRVLYLTEFLNPLYSR